MKVIKELTKKQWDYIPNHVEKWLSIATVPAKNINQNVNYIYREIGEKNPIVIHAESPFAACYMAIIAKLIFTNDTGSQFGASLWPHLWSQLSASFTALSKLSYQFENPFNFSHMIPIQATEILDFQLNFQLWFQLSYQLSAQLGSQLRYQLECSQHWLQLRSHLDSQLRSQFGTKLKEIEHQYHFITYWLTYCAWLEFGVIIGAEINKRTFNKYTEFVKNIHFMIPYKGICFVSEKPIEIHWQNKKLHNPNGCSVLYKDGTGLYSLNGVSVPKWLVEEKAEQIDVSKFARIKNAEVRREFIRKVGMERILQKVGGKLIDKSDDGIYELYLINLGGETNYRPYLKMLNPSIGIWHLEGVLTECDTVKKALAFRNGTKDEPIYIS